MLKLAKSKDCKCGNSSQNVKTRNEFGACLTCHFIDSTYIQHPLPISNGKSKGISKLKLTRLKLDL